MRHVATLSSLCTEAIQLGQRLCWVPAPCVDPSPYAAEIRRARGLCGRALERGQRLVAATELQICPRELHAYLKEHRVHLAEPTRLGERLIVAARIVQHAGQARVVDQREWVEPDGGLDFADRIGHSVSRQEKPRPEQMCRRITRVEGP